MLVDFGYTFLYTFVYFSLFSFFFLSTAFQNFKVSFPSIPNWGKELKYWFFFCESKIQQ